MKKIAAFLIFWLFGGPAFAQVTCSIPFTFVPNTTISSYQVNSNFTGLSNCFSDSFALQGTVTNDNAAAGNVGEYVYTSTISQSNIGTGNQAYNIVTLNLTPGDWQCWGNLWIFRSSSTNSYVGWISTASATFPATQDVHNHGTNGPIVPQSSFPVANDAWAPIGMVRESLAVTTPVYLEAMASGTNATQSAGGFLGCRRMR